MATKQEYRKFRPWLLVLSVLLLLHGLCVPAAWGEDDFRSAVQTAKESGVSEEYISRIMVVAYRYNLESKDLAGFLIVAAEAGRRKLPVEPFVGKIEEGLAKQVETHRIQQVLRHDLAQYGLVRDLLQNALSAKSYEPQIVQSAHMVRLARTLSMGITQSEMQSLFNDAPRVSIGEIVDAAEFTAALKQAGQEFSEAKEITVVGLESGFFTKTAWNLPLMVSAARAQQVPAAKIKSAALEVVKGHKTVLEAHTDLGLDPSSLARGPIVSAPSPGGGARGVGTGKGQPGAAVQGGQGSGAQGMGGAGSGGAGGGAGGGPGGPGGGGPGGGGGGGGGSGR